MVTSDQAQILKNLDQSYTDLTNSLRVAAAQATADAAPAFQQLNEALTTLGPQAISSVARSAASVVGNLTAIRDAALLAGLLLAGRFAAQAIAAAGALRGLSLAAVAARVGLAAFTGPLGVLAVAAATLGVYVLRTREATEATSEFARETERFLERGVVDQIDVLRGAISRYERQIVRLRGQLNEPLSLQGRLNLRAQIGQYEEELRDFRARLREAQQSAAPLPPVTAEAAPEAVAGAAVGRPRNVGADISAEIERQERISRQRIAILRAEGDARLRLEARYEVTNRLVDEQLRLSAALVTAKDAERARLQAEQQALDQSVAGIDALIAAKERQLRLDQEATQLQASIAESLQEAERRTAALTEAAARGTVDRAERLGPPTRAGRDMSKRPPPDGLKSWKTSGGPP